MYKVCSRCGRIHDINKKCYKGYQHKDTKANTLRKTYQWHKKSEEIKKDSQYLCSVCKDKDRYVYDNLEVHHIIPVNEDDTKALDNYNLICLCKDCHRQAESAKIDRQYLLKLAKDREDNK